jgi:hypothetical protein
MYAGPTSGRRGRVGIAVRWGAVGFGLGAGFWIYLGVSELTGVDMPLPQNQAPPAAPAPGCTTLMLDRLNGHTTATPCFDPRSLRDTLAVWLGAPWQR